MENNIPEWVLKALNIDSQNNSKELKEIKESKPIMDTVCHINATPEFFQNEKSVEVLGKMVDLANNICYKSRKPCKHNCSGLCKDSY